MIDMSPEAVVLRLQQAARAASLAPEARLDAKIDMSPQALARRLRTASELRAFCLRLSEAGRALRDDGPAPLR